MLCGIQSGMRDKEWRAEETPFKKLAVKGRSMSWRQLEGKILVGTVSVSLKSLSLHRSGTSNSTSFLWFSLSTESLARPPCWLWVWTLCEMYLCFPCHRVKDEQVVVFSYSVVSDSLGPHRLQHARLPCLHYLPDFAPSHILWVGDAIQPSPPLSPPSPPALSLSQHQGRCQGIHSLSQVAKDWSFSISPSSEYSGLISFRIDWISLLYKGLWRVFSSTTVWKPQFFDAQPSLWSDSHICIWLLEKP